MPLTRQQKDHNISDLEAYTMASEDVIDAKSKAFEMRMENKLCALFEEEDLEHEENIDEDLQSADCMVHAVAGYANPQMMKIGCFLKQQPVTILNDIESTNNFMDSKVAARSMLHIENYSKFNVKVAYVESSTAAKGAHE
ncbi:hypothetical protein B296_00003639 [Ensete ventricosum]|uniref:Uncharacterized protein n=1 Tax=Ensete ventricosum TaxID=4639 RepID=A0A427A2S4_ENSVE|nr:hypothetical protein B296_00003639 [Ensete ventricosum]